MIKVKEIFELAKDKKEYYLLKEYDSFKKLIEEMDAEQFKYVSYAFGGYKEIHKFAQKYDIFLLEHGKECFLCKEEKEEQNQNSYLSFLKFW